MKKKLLSALLAVAMVATLLAGCGKTETPATDDTTADATTTEEGVNLVYWSMWSSTEPQAIVIQEAIDAYEAETGNTVTVEWKGRDINTVIQAALDAKTQIDLFDDDFQRVATQYASNCADLEEMAAAADYDNHSVEALPTAIRGWAGSLKAIAYQPYTSGIFYNKAMFADAGITEEPQTWDEFLTVCEKLKESGVAPLVQDDAYVLYSYGFQLARYIGQDAIVDLSNNGGWAENEGVLKSAQDIENLVKSGYLSEYAPDAYPANENEIGFGNAAMIINASWVPGEITNNTQCDIEWGMFNFPSVDGGVDSNTVANVGAQAFAIPAYSENQQAAFDLIMKITTGEYDQKMALESNGIPADPNNTEWPEMIAGCRDAFNALTNVYDWNMGLNTNDDTKTVIQDGLMKLYGGSMTAEEFVASIEK